MLMRYQGQTRRDSDRKTYRLSFPAELEEEHILAFLESITGSLPKSGTRTIVFETWRTKSGITHRLKVPWQKSDFLLSQLRTHIPGIRAEPEEEWPKHNWTKAHELRLANSSRQLQFRSVRTLAHTVLSSTQYVKDDEAILIQWVISPAATMRLPQHKVDSSDELTIHSVVGKRPATKDEIQDRRDKLKYPNFNGVLRVATRASTPIRANHLLEGVRNALTSAQGHRTHFEKRFMRQDEVLKRVRAATSPVSITAPVRLNALELTAVIAWPIGNPNVAGLPAPMSKQFPPHAAVPSEGIIIGHSPFPGAERPLAISYDASMMHTSVTGVTGTGKTVLLGNMAKQIMGAGHGLILVETAGDLYETVLNYVPQERANDVILLDLSDHERPVGLNLLDQGNREQAIGQVMRLLNHQFPSGIWSQDYMIHGFQTIAEQPNLSFIDIVPLLNPMTPDEVEWADAVARSVRDPELRRWWQNHDNKGKQGQQQRADTVLNRVWPLVSFQAVRNVLGQSTSSFQLSDVLENNKILLVNLKNTPDASAALIGSLLLNTIWELAQRVSKTRSTYLMIDEYADTLNIPVDTHTMLAQARKHNLGLILATQFLGQLSKDMRDAVLTNTRNKVSFQSNHEDSRALASALSGGVDPFDVTSLGAFQAIAQVMTNEGTSGAMSVHTYPPARATGRAESIRALSRQTYGRPIDEVRRDMEARHQEVVAPKKQRPRIAGDGWNQN